jgi:hypothetical protein
MSRRATTWPARALTLLEQLWHEGRLAGRRLWATPLFTLFAALSLALGLGTMTVIYSVVDALLWKPIGIPNPSTLVVLTAARGSYQSWLTVHSLPDFVDVSATMRTLPNLAASSRIYAPLGDARAPVSATCALDEAQRWSAEYDHPRRCG